MGFWKYGHIKAIFVTKSMKTWVGRMGEGRSNSFKFYFMIQHSCLAKMQSEYMFLTNSLYVYNWSFWKQYTVFVFSLCFNQSCSRSVMCDSVELKHSICISIYHCFSILRRPIDQSVCKARVILCQSYKITLGSRASGSEAYLRVMYFVVFVDLQKSLLIY